MQTWAFDISLWNVMFCSRVYLTLFFTWYHLTLLLSLQLRPGQGISPPAPTRRILLLSSVEKHFKLFFSTTCRRKDRLLPTDSRDLNTRTPNAAHTNHKNYMKLHAYFIIYSVLDKTVCVLHPFLIHPSFFCWKQWWCAKDSAVCVVYLLCHPLTF